VRKQCAICRSAQEQPRAAEFSSFLLPHGRNPPYRHRTEMLPSGKRRFASGEHLSIISQATGLRSAPSGAELPVFEVS
jgi:hypothetical protein